MPQQNISHDPLIDKDICLLHKKVQTTHEQETITRIVILQEVKAGHWTEMIMYSFQLQPVNLACEK